MALNYHRHPNSRRYSVCETKPVSNAQHQSLFSNFYNLPIVHSVKQSTSPTKPSLKIKPIPFVAEKFVHSEVFDNQDNFNALKLSLIKRRQQEESKQVPQIDQATRVNTNYTIEKNEFSIRAQTIPARIEKSEASRDSTRNQEQYIFRKRDKKISTQNRQNSIQLTDSFKKLNYTLDCPIYEINNECFETTNILKKEDVSQETQPLQDKSAMRTAAIILEHHQPLMEMEKIQKKQNYRIPKKISKQYKRLRLLFYFVRAAMRISQKIRQQKKIQLTQYDAVLKLREPHHKHLSMYGVKNIKGEHQKYIKMVSNKMLHFFMEKKFVTECKQIWDKKSDFEKDVRRTRFSAFSQMFLQNLELLTRGDNLPILIQHQLNNCLFKTKNMQISQFVSKRSNIFSRKVTFLTSKEKVLLATEFFVYQVVIPSLLELVNDIDSSSVAHINQTMFYCFGLASMMQILFTNYFSNMKEAKKTNITPIQRRVTIQTSEKNGMMNALIEIDQKLEQDETQILFGCFQRGSIVDIFYQKPDWNDKMKRLFSQLVSNLQCQIQI